MRQEPVLYFESFYNHRIHNEFSMPPISELVDKYRRRNENVCTFGANFHIFLGKISARPILPSRLSGGLTKLFNQCIDYC
jgi:hypothetical protein